MHNFTEAWNMLYGCYTSFGILWPSVLLVTGTWVHRASKKSTTKTERYHRRDIAIRSSVKENKHVSKARGKTNNNRRLQTYTTEDMPHGVNSGAQCG